MTQHHPVVKSGMTLAPHLLEQMRTPQIPVAIDGLDFPIWRMRAAAGSDVLLSLDDEAVTVALEWPEGVAGAAEKHLAQGETQKAARLLEQPMETLTPQWAAAKVHLLVSEGALDLAKSYLDELPDEPEFGLAHATLALQNQEMALVDEGLESSRTAMQHYVTWQYLVGLKFVVLGRAHQAAGVFQRIVQNESEHGLALYRLGWLAKNLGDTARSGILLEQVLERSPKILEAGITLTELFLQSNMAGEALNVLETVGKHHPSALTPWVLRVRILLAVGNIPMAAEIAEQLKQQRPDDPEILLLYAECEQAAGRYDGAKAQLLQMVNRVEFSQKAQAYLQLAQICQKQGGRQNIEQAVSFYEQAAQFGGLDSKTRFQLVQLKWQVGQEKSAEEHIRMIGEDTDINVLLAAAVWAHERQLNHSKFLARWARINTANTPLASQVNSILIQAGL